MKRSIHHAVMLFVVLPVFASLAACAKKEMTIEECRAKCVQVISEQDAKCTMGTDFCSKVKTQASENCEKTCKTYSETYGGGK